jgi:hypothetical protein
MYRAVTTGDYLYHFMYLIIITFPVYVDFNTRKRKTT